MKLLAFSDWRTQSIKDIFTIINHLKEQGEFFDFILYGGDDIRRFKEGKINYFSELAKLTKRQTVLAVIGNDDGELQEVKSIIQSQGVYDLYNEPFICGNTAFMGIEGSTCGPGMTKHTEKEIEEHLNNQYNKVKHADSIIILSHTPPRNILDIGRRFAFNKPYHNIGSTSLRKFVTGNRKVRLIVCGHAHTCGGQEEKYKNKFIVNASSHDSMYSPGNLALIELDDNRKIEIKWYSTRNVIDGIRNKLQYVGFKRASLLMRCGIDSLSTLIGANPNKLSRKSGLSSVFIKKIQLRATASEQNKIIQIKPFTVTSDNNTCFFDIETDLNCERIWLIGCLYQDKIYQFYADRWGQESKILNQLTQFVATNQIKTLISFSGTNFDYRVVRNALKRHNNVFAKNLPVINHVDLRTIIQRSFIFPFKEYKLKTIGNYLGYKFKYSNMDGIAIALDYMEHIRTRKPLNKRVFAYNADDVKVMPYIIEKLTSKTESDNITVQIPVYISKRRKKIMRKPKNKERTKHRSISIKEETYQRLVQGAKYGDSIDTIIQRILDKLDEKSQESQSALK